MQTNIRFPSKRLFIALFISATAIILLQNYSLSPDSSFTFILFTILTGLFISFLFFIPSMLIKKKTNLDFISFAHRETPSAIIFVSAYYSLYFVYAIEYFLINYTDMFLKKLNPDANKFVIALILVAVCVYSACKGVNAISRTTVFILFISLVWFILIFSGLVPSLDFTHNSFEISGNTSDFIFDSQFFLTSSFIAVIFAFTSGYTDKFKISHSIFSLIFIAVLFALFTFFLNFSLGSYANNQEYQSFVLSKASQLGTIGGLDGLYLSLSTTAVFTAISLIFCCIAKSLGNNGSIKNISIFAVIIFVLFICSATFNSVREILTNKYVFNTLNFISAVFIPSIYILGFRRHLYEDRTCITLP